MRVTLYAVILDLRNFIESCQVLFNAIKNFHNSLNKQPQLVYLTTPLNQVAALFQNSYLTLSHFHSIEKFHP